MMQSFSVPRLHDILMTEHYGLGMSGTEKCVVYLTYSTRNRMPDSSRDDGRVMRTDRTP